MINVKYKIYFLILSLMMFSGCDLGDKNNEPLSDAELIQMIIDASKLEIDMDDLPENSLEYINNDISYDEIASRVASGLGFEVELVGNGYRSGDRNEFYFNLEGRKLDPNDWGNKRSEGDRQDKEDWQCFDLIYPVTFEMPDGSTIIVETDDEEGWLEIKIWYDDNQETEERPSIQFPVVIFFDDEYNTINSNEELREAYAECRPERRRSWEDRDQEQECFTLVYPVSFTMPDGSTITVENDDEDGWNELKTWYDDNPGYEEVMPEFQYPVDISYWTEDGESTLSINNQEEMEAAKNECREEWENDEYDEDCFELVLPVTYLMPDGSTITVESEEGYIELRNWYDENGVEDDGAEPTLEYPVDILYETEDGDMTITINDGGELEEAYAECYGDDDRP